MLGRVVKQDEDAASRAFLDAPALGENFDLRDAMDYYSANEPNEAGGQFYDRRPLMAPAWTDLRWASS